MTTSNNIIAPTPNSNQLPFEKWRKLVESQTSHHENNQLCEEAKTFFSSHQQLPVPVPPAVHDAADNVNIADSSSSNVDGATAPSFDQLLALLVKEMGIPMSQGTHVSKIWALSCITGAIEGCQHLSFSILNLIGNFLLTYCGPLEEEIDMQEDTEEIVRDYAISCFTPLLRSNIIQSSNNADLLSALLRFGKQAVEARCLTLQDQDDPYDHGFHESTMRSNLSKLPRSRRALCFDLLQATLDGIASLQTNAEDNNTNIEQLDEMVAFASFASGCLHGESDPRCVMQLLVMISSLQTTLAPYFQTNKDRFPVLDIFDAIAPYYPVQFTPPPNDKHGITRASLQRALMNVMSFTELDSDDVESMFSLSLGIILEALTPMDDNQAETMPVKETMQSLRDLESILLPRCNAITVDIARELSSVLFQTHTNAAMLFASGGDSSSKELLEKTRNLISKIASNVESNNELWNILIQDTLKDQSSVLSSTPDTIQGKTTIEYMACIAASGTAKNLNATLSVCLPRLLEALSEPLSNEKKKGAATMGVATLLSSTLAALERGTKAGVSFVPHPIQPYCTLILSNVVPLFNQSKSLGCKLAALRAMDAFLLVVPATSLTEDDTIQVTTFFSSLCQQANTVQQQKEQQHKTNVNNDQLDSAVAACLGTIIGRTIGKERLSSILAESDAVKQHINNEVPRLLSSLTNVPSSDADRFDTMVLAYACEVDKSVASMVVNHALQALQKELSTSSSSQERLHSRSVCQSIASNLKLILIYGGMNAKTSLINSDTNVDDILDLLCDPSMDEKSELAINLDMSNLVIPATNVEKKQFEDLIEFGFNIVSNILPAFDAKLPLWILENLVERLSQVLPPLSDSQHCRLCILLPLLSKVVQQFDFIDPTSMKLQEMAHHLSDFALSREAPRVVRSHSIDCLFFIICRHQAKDCDCVSSSILQESILPELSAQTKRDSSLQQDAVSHAILNDCLGLLAVVGAATAIRGRSSMAASNSISDFLIGLACHGEASIGQVHVSRRDADTSAQAATAFGAMISAESKSPFWRQRLLHKAVQRLETAGEIAWGCLVLTAHIVIYTKLSSLSKSSHCLVRDKLIYGLSQIVCSNGAEANLMEVVLAAMVKMIASKYELNKNHVGQILHIALILLRDRKEVGIKVLCVEILCQIISQKGDKETKLLSKWRPAVTSVLHSQLDHSSMQLRQMMTEAQNEWSAMDWPTD